MQTNGKRVLLFGSGLVSKPVLLYFSQFDGYKVTVVTNDKSSGEELVRDFKGKAECVVAKVEDKSTCLKLVKEHDIALSLLPAPLHPIITLIFAPVSALTASGNLELSARAPVDAIVASFIRASSIVRTAECAPLKQTLESSLIEPIQTKERGS